MRTTISANGQPETVSPHELAQVMQAGVPYSQDAVLDMLPGRPRSSIRDTLHTMVNKGQVWRNNQRGTITFQLLEGEALQKAIDKQMTCMEPPAWMKRNLIGYEAEQNRVRALCMTVRK